MYQKSFQRRSMQLKEFFFILCRPRKYEVTNLESSWDTVLVFLHFGVLIFCLKRLLGYYDT